MTKTAEIKQNLEWFSNVEKNANANAYQQDSLENIWSNIYNRAENLAESIGDDNIDSAVSGDNGTIENGEDLQDLMLEQAEQASDPWITHQYIVGAAKIDDLDGLYVIYDDPTDVNPVTNETLSGVLSDIVYDLQDDLKGVTA